MPETNNTDLASIITQNKEEWDRLLFLLKDPEPNILWINCDTALLKKPLHDAVCEYFPQLKPYDIYIDEKTESLTKIILWEDKGKIPEPAIIHIFGMEDAVKSAEFLGNVNFQRDSLFRQTPATIIFWTDFATGTIMTHKAYDFWSWVVFTFDFTTPEGLLTARQKGFQNELILEDITIHLPQKDSSARIKHLEAEWEKFLKSVSGKPSTKKQMKDAIAIARALADEYRDEGKFQQTIDLIQYVFKLNSELINDEDSINFNNTLAVVFTNLGEDKKAIEILEKVLKKAIGTYGEENINVANLNLNLAVAYRGTGQLEQARVILEKTLNTLENLEENNPDIAIHQSVLGLIYCDLGLLEKAKNLLEAALKSDIKNFGENHHRIAIRLSNLGTVYRDLKQFNKVIELLTTALDIDIKNYGFFHPNVAIRFSNLGFIYKDLNQIESAKYNIKKSYDIKSCVYGENHPKTQDTLNFLKQLEDEPRPTP